MFSVNLGLRQLAKALPHVLHKHLQQVRTSWSPPSSHPLSQTSSVLNIHQASNDKSALGPLHLLGLLHCCVLPCARPKKVTSGKMWKKAPPSEIGQSLRAVVEDQDTNAESIKHS